MLIFSLTREKFYCMLTVLIQLVHLIHLKKGEMCVVHLDYRDARPIYTQIADNFRNQIRAGVLIEGDKLPSVRELASDLAINPNTIQRAYRELEADGWIASVTGKGSFVCGAPRQENPEAESLWQELDAVTAKLAEAGISRQAILQYLKQGGDHNA